MPILATLSQKRAVHVTCVTVALRVERSITSTELAGTVASLPLTTLSFTLQMVSPSLTVHTHWVLWGAEPMPEAPLCLMMCRLTGNFAQCYN